MHQRLVSLLALAFVAPLGPASPQTTLVSVGPNDEIGDSQSYCGNPGYHVSASGQYVAFSSSATNFAPLDSNAANDAFVRDVWAGETEWVSLGSTGQQASAASSAPQVSANGRYVAFGTDSPGLVPDDVGSGGDVFVRDLNTGTVELITRDSLGDPVDDLGPFALSHDFRRLAFTSFSSDVVPGDTNGTADIFLVDRDAVTVTRVSMGFAADEPNGFSTCARISADGRFVVYESLASNLVPGDTNGATDVFVYDSELATTERVSVATGGAQVLTGGEPGISGDGRYVVFESIATDLVPFDTNGDSDVFVHDRWMGETRRVSVTTGGIQSNGDSFEPAISADGRFVAFVSVATNLAPGSSGTQQVYRHDLVTGVTERVSEDGAGFEANASFNRRPALSADGRFIAFQSFATNLGDPGYAGQDVYLRDMGPPSGPATYCLAQRNSQGCLPAMDASGAPSTSVGNGFIVGASNLLNQRSGILFYSTIGAQMLPFSDHYLCVIAPLRRTGIQTSGGSTLPTTDCSGRIEIDFNAWIAGGADPGLTSGVQVWAQIWSRDPTAGSTTNLTDGVTFVIGP